MKISSSLLIGTLLLVISSATVEAADVFADPATFGKKAELYQATQFPRRPVGLQVQDIQFDSISGHYFAIFRNSYSLFSGSKIMSFSRFQKPVPRSNPIPHPQALALSFDGRGALVYSYKANSMSRISKVVFDQSVSHTIGAPGSPGRFIGGNGQAVRLPRISRMASVSDRSVLAAAYDGTPSILEINPETFDVSRVACSGEEGDSMDGSILIARCPGISSIATISKADASQKTFFVQDDGRLRVWEGSMIRTITKSTKLTTIVDLVVDQSSENLYALSSVAHQGHVLFIFDSTNGFAEYSYLQVADTDKNGNSGLLGGSARIQYPGIKTLAQSANGELMLGTAENAFGISEAKFVQGRYMEIQFLDTTNFCGYSYAYTSGHYSYSYRPNSGGCCSISQSGYSYSYSSGSYSYSYRVGCRYGYGYNPAPNPCISADCHGNAQSFSGNQPSCTCSCKTGFTGSRCNACAAGFDSYPNCYRTCTTAADCSGKASSVSGNVNSGCSCTCSTGFTGSSCNACASGYESYPNCYRTCTVAADCNGKATAVSGNSNSGCSCTCQTGYTGASCNTCATNYGGSPCAPLACASSHCNNNGVIAGNQVTGCSCSSCSTGFTGSTCNACAAGYESYPNCYRTCTVAADCNGQASAVSGNVNSGCTCTCNTGYTGPTCNGAAGCSVAGDCNGNANSVSGDQVNGCVCSCMTGYTGASCNTCATNYGGSPCAPLACASSHCNNNGVIAGNQVTGCSCSSCSTGFTGSTCNACAAGYESYPNCYRTCTVAADCNGQASAVSGTVNSGCTCTCNTGFTGSSCNSCASGYESYPICTLAVSSPPSAASTTSVSTETPGTVSQGPSPTSAPLADIRLAISQKKVTVKEGEVESVRVTVITLDLPVGIARTYKTVRCVASGDVLSVGGSSGSASSVVEHVVTSKGVSKFDLLIIQPLQWFASNEAELTVECLTAQSTASFDVTMVQQSANSEKKPSILQTAPLLNELPSTGGEVTLTGTHLDQLPDFLLSGPYVIKCSRISSTSAKAKFGPLITWASAAAGAFSLPDESSDTKVFSTLLESSSDRSAMKEFASTTESKRSDLGDDSIIPPTVGRGLFDLDTDTTSLNLLGHVELRAASLLEIEAGDEFGEVTLESALIDPRTQQPVEESALSPVAKTAFKDLTASSTELKNSLTVENSDVSGRRLSSVGRISTNVKRTASIPVDAARIYRFVEYKASFTVKVLQAILQVNVRNIGAGAFSCQLSSTRALARTVDIEMIAFGPVSLRILTNEPGCTVERSGRLLCAFSALGSLPRADRRQNDSGRRGGLTEILFNISGPEYYTGNVSLSVRLDADNAESSFSEIIVRPMMSTKENEDVDFAATTTAAAQKVTEEPNVQGGALNSLGIFANTSGDVTCLDPLVFSLVIYLILFILASIWRFVSPPEPCTNTREDIALARSVRLNHMYLQAVLPCHSDCGVVHITNLGVHVLTIITTTSALNAFLDSGSSTSFWLVVLLPPFIAQPVTVATQFFYHMHDNTARVADRNTLDELQKETSVAPPDLKRALAGTHRGYSSTLTHLDSARTPGSESQEIAALENIELASNFSSDAGSSAESVEEINLDLEPIDDVVKTQKELKYQTKVGGTLARLAGDADFTIEEELDTESLSATGENSLETPRKPHKQQVNLGGTVVGFDAETGLDDEEPQAIDATLIVSPFRRKGHVFAFAFSFLMVAIGFMLIHSFRTADACNSFLTTLRFGLLGDILVFQTLRVLFTFFYRWMVSGAGDKSWSELHPFHGQEMKYKPQH